MAQPSTRPTKLNPSRRQGNPPPSSQGRGCRMTHFLPLGCHNSLDPAIDHATKNLYVASNPMKGSKARNMLGTFLAWKRDKRRNMRLFAKVVINISFLSLLFLQNFVLYFAYNSSFVYDKISIWFVILSILVSFIAFISLTSIYKIIVIAMYSILFLYDASGLGVYSYIHEVSSPDKISSHVRSHEIFFITVINGFIIVAIAFKGCVTLSKMLKTDLESHSG